MSPDLSSASPQSSEALINSIVSRIIRQEIAKSQSARQRAERRRSATQRARTFDKAALAAVARG